MLHHRLITSQHSPELIGSIFDFLKSDKTVLSYINKEELLEIENLEYHTKHVDHIFQKVFET